MQSLLELSPSHWLILSVVLLVLEVFGAGGFMIGMAVAGVMTSLLLWLQPALSWQLQLLCFAVVSVVATVAYWKYFRGFNNATDQPQLNNRTQQLVGRRWQLDQDLPTGSGRQQIGDTYWKVRSQGALRAGDLVEVYGSEGSELLIRLVDPKS
ncbi:hypothetical protein EDC56_1848 [Sinobacterium caligoides]|uniref:NfeD-like C-terminal domain-containing protein n=1 Tax=Sinobacterium caligoides TaxID=933926 RepID=A0A3N2DNM8_9GAMM|nr:NfeD family protein [Sinobacterium caligoides]ROS01407.1 hypothetical protein EDC56_1848 [Sinobacterium caligoides]